MAIASVSSGNGGERFPIREPDGRLNADPRLADRERAGKGCARSAPGIRRVSEPIARRAPPTRPRASRLPDYCNGATTFPLNLLLEGLVVRNPAIRVEHDKQNMGPLRILREIGGDPVGDLGGRSVASHVLRFDQYVGPF